MKVNLNNCVSVDCYGEGRHRRGGLAMLWKDDTDITLHSMSLNHMGFVVSMSNDLNWRLTGIYGHPEKYRKDDTWKMLVELGDGSTMPWLCLGDFNGILNHAEKQGGNSNNQRQIYGFRQEVESCQLRDIHFEGFPFTWTNNRADGDNVQ